jgi:hypothetical protein
LIERRQCKIFSGVKEYLSTALALVCAVLVVSIVLVKRSDNAQHETDAGDIASFSNRLDTAQTQIAIGNGTIMTLSNSLNESELAVLNFSNQLAQAQLAIVLDAEQITNLNQQVAELEDVKSENQQLSQRTMDLTNQVVGLMKQNALADASLEQANKNYALLENRLRRDVVERTVLERKFNNPSALQVQMQVLKQNPDQEISSEGIYADLGVEVKSDGSLHVISTN